MIAELYYYICGILIIIGSAFALVASIGLLRVPDFYSRMHAASKAGTLGSGLLLIGMSFVAEDGAVAARAIAGFVFLLLTAPISAHLLAKASYAAGFAPWRGTVHNEMPPRAEMAKQK